MRKCTPLSKTLFNVRRKIQGWCDSPLTELGISQAKIAGQYFKDNNITYGDFFVRFDGEGEMEMRDRISDTLLGIMKIIKLY